MSSLLFLWVAVTALVAGILIVFVMRRKRLLAAQTRATAYDAPPYPGQERRRRPDRRVAARRAVAIV
ncbi:MAG: hypothetical protein HY903_23895 [Deltaproteobacteria bacterium]|nr:hypothetical protein [Deltaproteobacteria bacterium]